MKKVKLFEQFVNEASKVDKKDFDKVVAAVKKANKPATVLFTPKWNEIEILIGDAPESTSRAISDQIDKLGYGSNTVTIAADSSSYSRREYDAIERINGGH